MALSEHTNTLNTHVMSKRLSRLAAYLILTHSLRVKFRGEWGKMCHFLLKFVVRGKNKFNICSFRMLCYAIKLCLIVIEVQWHNLPHARGKLYHVKGNTGNYSLNDLL